MQEEIEQLKAKCDSLFRKSDWVVLSGSTPCGGMDILYGELIEMSSKYRARVVLDTYHEPLRYGIELHPFMIKPNIRESEATFGIELKTEDEIVGLIKRLKEKEIPLIVITDGRNLAYACFEDKIWRVAPPPIKTVNPTGSGDTMIAGMIFGLVNNWEIEDIIRYGTAAGAANASVWKIAACSRKEIDTLAPRVKLELTCSC
jgi:fructose-1-phosphate kinase PfkB-like protein